MNDEEKRAKLVNDSGFLFQIAVEEHVRATTSRHSWSVEAREYPWNSPKGDRSGFIDFVAARGSLRSVVECKRTRGGEWVFLLPEKSEPTVQLRTLWSFLAWDKVNDWGWSDLQFEPAMLRSEFCIVRGSSDDDRPMLERIAAEVVRAAESLACEELAMNQQHPGSSGYLPVIVTNAKLVACHVSLTDVNLQAGELPPSARFEEIGAIRFQKALPSDLVHLPDSYASMSEALRIKERSVFVVNVGHLAHWLAAVRQVPRSLSSPPDPWRHMEK